jgi:hypothetical protein
MKYTPCLAGSLCGDLHDCPFKHDDIDTKTRDPTEFAYQGVSQSSHYHDIQVSELYMNSSSSFHNLSLDHIPVAIPVPRISQTSSNKYPIQSGLRGSDFRCMDPVNMGVNNLHTANVVATRDYPSIEIGQNIEQIIMKTCPYPASSRSDSSTSPVPTLTCSEVSSLSSTPLVPTPPASITRLRPTTSITPEDVLYEAIPVMRRARHGSVSVPRITVPLKPKNTMNPILMEASPRASKRSEKLP